MENILTFIFVAVHCSGAVIDKSIDSSVMKNSYQQTSIFKDFAKTSILEIEEKESKPGMNVTKTRFKRQASGGASKFTEAATMPQLKALRLFLTMFKNLWAPSYVGGAHPFHHNVPKPIVQLFKHRIVDFFFPDVGEDAKKV